MSSIPPHSGIIGSIAQAQVAAPESAKAADAQRNKRAQDARQLARLADQQEHEVETADQAENLRVHRQDERERNGQDARDTYAAHDKNAPAKLYHPDPDPALQTPPESPPDDHIDLSA